MHDLWYHLRNLPDQFPNLRIMWYNLCNSTSLNNVFSYDIKQMMVHSLWKELLKHIFPCTGLHDIHFWIFPKVVGICQKKLIQIPQPLLVHDHLLHGYTVENDNKFRSRILNQILSQSHASKMISLPRQMTCLIVGQILVLLLKLNSTNNLSILPYQYSLPNLPNSSLLFVQ